MGKWFNRRMEGLLDNAIFAAIVAGGTVIGSLLNQLPGVIVFVIGLAVFVLVLMAINQYALLKERRKKRLTQLSGKELGKLIREWLDIPAFTVQKQDDVRGVSFAFNVTLDNLTVHLERQEKEPLVVQLVGGIVLSRQDKTMSEFNWERLASQISIEMARLGIQWRFDGISNKWEHISLIESVILDDSFTGLLFRPRVMLVMRALILVIAVAKEFFREIPDKPVPDKEVS